MNKYKSETNDANKKKIMFLGAILVFGWMFAGSYLKPQRVSIEFENVEIYQSDRIVKSDIIGKIAEYDDMDSFVTTNSSEDVFSDF